MPNLSLLFSLGSHHLELLPVVVVAQAQRKALGMANGRDGIERERESKIRSKGHS